MAVSWEKQLGSLFRSHNGPTLVTMIRRSIAAALLSIFLAGASPAPERPLVLAFGDSLTAGYGLDQGLGFAPQLQATLRRHGVAAKVVDGGVSGDTTEAGKARLGWTLDGLERKPDLVILELGANDMLRGLDPELTETNLDAMLSELKRRQITVLFAGMRAAPNLDPAYISKFEGIYPSLARKHGEAIYPFFLEGVAAQQGLVQADGMHPTFAGVKIIVTGITPDVKQALKRP
jgi:acyl-CoA thioesterase-1